ncbi:MAG TPA: hypothetical protein VKR56_03885 [Candidatus Cybelea sp.]|jgi:hypothetical protein|nr:hypothetical protein [Candidatus Cybelea sp.]
MRPLVILSLAFVLISGPVAAQTAQAPLGGTFEGVTIGEPMANLRPTLGDPVGVKAAGNFAIWRYLTHGDGVYLDVLVKNNVAQSVTVVSRLSGVAYVAPSGVAFWMTPDQVRAKLGPPRHESTNADDGSLDLWYAVLPLPYAWIYEFHANKLDFVQLIASPDVLRQLASGPVAMPNDGTSLANAIWIRPPNQLANSVWIDVFLATNACGNGGHWKELSSKLVADTAKNDPMAYLVEHARCSDGSSERDFFFDTHGSPSPPPAQKPNVK